MKKTLLGTALAALTMGLLTATPSVQAAPSASSGQTTARTAATVPPVAWGPCADELYEMFEFDCGTVSVPRDYADPDGVRIKIAVTRLKATAEPYRGAMLVNPGGPGGSGTIMPILQDWVPGGAGHHYDWIGFDPRGVADSRPALRCGINYFTPNRPNYVPSTTSILDYWKNKARRYSAACKDSASGSLLPYLTTAHTVRDMDVIRRALRQERISFYGFSYGSYLGMGYLKFFPNRVHRMVMDGVVDPTRAWYGANLDQNRAFDRNLDVYWQWLAKRPARYRLGSDWKKIRATYYATLRKLDRTPAAGGLLGPDELNDAMLGAGYYVYDWDQMGLSFSRLVRTGNGDDFVMEAADDNSYATYLATVCTDAPWPGAARMISDSRELHRTAPFLTWNNTWFNYPCMSWKAPKRSRMAMSGKGVTRKILLISETRDAATPYSGALKARQLFPSASLIAGVGGTTHSSSLSGVACVDDAVARYLTSGAVPTRVVGNRSDKQCPKVTPYVGDGFRESAARRLVREAMRDAQRL